MTKVNNVEQFVAKNDSAIANKLYRIRNLIGIEREILASALEISVSELENYEQAIEAIPASTLVLIALKLGVNINYFYEDESSETTEYLNQTLQNNDPQFFFVSNTSKKVKAFA